MRILTKACTLVLPRRACETRVTQLVCPSVRLSLHASSRATGYEATYEQYYQLQGYESEKAIFLKRLRDNKRENKRKKHVRLVQCAINLDLAPAQWRARSFSPEHAHTPRGYRVSPLSVLISVLNNTKLSKIRTQCSTTVHVRRAVCGCGPMPSSLASRKQ